MNMPAEKTWLTVGPMTLVDLNRVKEILEGASAPFEILHSKEEIAKYKAEIATIETTSNPTFRELKKIVYLRFPMEHSLLVKGELEQLGYPIGPTAEPLPDEPEFFCPQCDYQSNAPITCPKHNVRLLEFSDWVKAKGNRKLTWQDKLFAAIAVAAFLALMYWMQTR